MGGAGDDGANDLAIDASGSVYLTGGENSSDFPVTGGAYQTSFGGGYGGDGVQAGDAYVTKLDASGSTLVYSTFLGGSANDQGLSIAIDASGNAFAGGQTDSTNFPTTAGAFRTSRPGSHITGFVTKINAAGSGADYSTYLGGGNNFDRVQGIALDAAGNAVAAGATNSSDFPTTPGAYQTSFGGDSDVFVTKLNSTGTGQIYSTLIGGSGGDEGFRVAVGVGGAVYVTGRTSGSYPITMGAIQASFGGGTYDAFVTKLNATASSVLSSTYLGGSGDENGLGIDVDPSRRVFLAGGTNSTN